MVYAPAGIMAGYLLGALGPEEFINLYRDYSGWPGDLAVVTAGAIRQDFERRLGLEPGGLAPAVKTYAETLPRGGIEPGPGRVGGEIAEVAAEDFHANITVGGEWVLFDVVFRGDMRAGAVMVGPPGDPRPAVRLFAERFPDRL